MNEFKFLDILKVYRAPDAYDRKKKKHRRLQFAAYVLLGILLLSFRIYSAFIYWLLLLPAAALRLCGLCAGTFIGLIPFIVFPVDIFMNPAGKIFAELSMTAKLSFNIACVMVYLVSLRMVFDEKREKINSRARKLSLEDAVKVEHDRFQTMMTQTITSISNAVDARDSYTRYHSIRVAEYSVLLAKKLGWEQEKIEQLRQIALLHDIGKIGISDSILKKSSSLTEEEYNIIKEHTVIGGDILKDLTLLPEASVGAIGHHERWDGQGYPYGLKGEQIPKEARIIAIADSFDAMNTSRIYRKRITSGKILEELRAGSGTQFDPQMVEAFLPVAEKLLYDPDFQGTDGENE